MINTTVPFQIGLLAQEFNKQFVAIYDSQQVGIVTPIGGVGRQGAADGGGQLGFEGAAPGKPIVMRAAMRLEEG